MKLRTRMIDLPLQSGSFRRLFRVDDVTKHNTVKIYFFPEKKIKTWIFFSPNKKWKKTPMPLSRCRPCRLPISTGMENRVRVPLLSILEHELAQKIWTSNMHQLDDKVTLSDLSSNFNFLLGSCETIFYLFLPDTLWRAMNCFWWTGTHRATF